MPNLFLDRKFQKVDFLKTYILQYKVYRKTKLRQKKYNIKFKLFASLWDICTNMIKMIRKRKMNNRFSCM